MTATQRGLSILLTGLGLCAARVSLADGAGGGGFASPIPLPPLSQVTAHQCVEKVLHQGTAANTWNVNNDTLVDLGIFHIHDGIEHAGTGDACASRCPGRAREAHLPLGLASCKAGVDARTFAADWRGRKAKADALLGCAKAVISFAVCLDGTAVTVDLSAIYPNLEREMCVNWGGPTGSHAGDQGMVQWVHYRKYCGSLTSNAANISVTNEAGKLHMSPTAEAVGADLRDRPWCGLEGTGCSECGYLHTRCCERTRDDWWYRQYPASMDGCDKAFETLHCENGRCVPEPPPPPNAGMCAADGVDCVTCVGLEGCVWQNGECHAAEWSTCTTITEASACEESEPADAGVVSTVADAGVIDAGSPWTPYDAGIAWTAPDAGYPWWPADAGDPWTPHDAGDLWTPPDAGDLWTPPDAGNWTFIDAGDLWTPHDAGDLWTPHDAGDLWTPPDAGSTWTPHDAGEMWTAPDAGSSWSCGLYGGSSCFSCLGYGGCVWDDGLCVNVEHADFDAVSTWQGCVPSDPDAGAPIFDAGITTTTAVAH